MGKGKEEEENERGGKGKEMVEQGRAREGKGEEKFGSQFIIKIYCN